MPSIINSTTTSPGGLISTGASDNVLNIQTGDVTAITVSSAQVVTLANPLPAASGGTGSTTGITALNASNLTSGTVPDARFPATLPAASGVNLTSLNASNIASGTVPTARLASGTANSTTFLRGDSTWATAGASAPVVQDFTASGTWTKPASGTMCSVLIIGGGGGGPRNGANGSSVGGGGACPVLSFYRLSDLPATVAVTIAGGGAPAASVSVPSATGGTSSFGTLIIAPGGVGRSSVNGSGDVSPGPAFVTDANSFIDTLTVGRAGGSQKAIAASPAFGNPANLLYGDGRGSSDPAQGGYGGANTGGAAYGSNTQNYLGTGGTGSIGGTGANGTGFGSGGGAGFTGGGTGAPGFCRVMVW